MTTFLPDDATDPHLPRIRDRELTYLLDGLRSLVLADTWRWGDLGQAVIAIGIVGTVSMAMCFAALRGRVRRG